MDDTMADTVGEHLSRYNAEHGLNVSREEFHGKWLWDHVPEAHRPSLKRSMSGDDFFEELAVFPHAVRVLERLQQHYEIYIATAAMIFPNSFASKYRWLKRHVPFIPSEPLCVLRGQEHPARGLPDRRHSGVPGPIFRTGILFTQGHNVRGDEVSAGEGLAGGGGVFSAGCKALFTKGLANDDSDKN